MHRIATAAFDAPATDAYPDGFLCPVDVTLSVIGGKWKLLIYDQLHRGVTRFGQLKRAIPRITQTMLTQQLRELEQDGIVTRTVYAEVPPRVEYALTDFGRTLECVIAVMCQWGTRYQAEVVAAKRGGGRPGAAAAALPEA
jgi:DNA-binding HxlR family transcriptional regulator